MANGFDPNNFSAPNLNGKLIRNVAIAVIVLIGLLSSVYTVATEEEGVVLRFGEYVETRQPGLNFIMPFGIDQMIKVPVKRQLKEEFGFRTEEAAVRSRYSSSRAFDAEAEMLSGDLNAVQVEWVAQYTINDPFKYLFKVRNVQSTFRFINEAVMREIVGDQSFDEVITIGRNRIGLEAKERIQDLCDQYETGIKVDQIILQDVNPPEPVKPSFNQVNEAEQRKNELINQAESEYNKVIPKAEGEAKRLIEEARGYAIARINNAQGEAQRFIDLYNEFRKAREVTRQRLYLETMQDILNKSGKKIILDENVKGLYPLLNLNQATGGGKN